MKDSQASSGKIPQIAPGANSTSTNLPIWTSIFINGYYENWRTNGITTDFAENYDALRAQTLSYITDIENNGWVWTTGGYADWVSPNDTEQYTTGKTTHAPEGAGIIGSAYVYEALDHMAQMADYLGKTDDAAEYRSAMENIYTAFNTTFYSADKGYYATGYWNNTYGGGRTTYRQSSNIIPLMFGLCPEEYEKSIVQSVVDDIIAKDYHLDVGTAGTKYILPMLSKYGYGDIAMKLICQDTYPSWGYWISLGANTCWEMYESNARSHNHFFLGTYTDWFYKNLAGVRDFANGYETLVLKPEIHGEIGYVNYTLDTVRGALKSYWYFTEDNKLIWEVTIPTGTTATVYLPDNSATVNGKALALQDGITVNADSLTMLSGEYSFVMDATHFEVDKSLLNAAVAGAKKIDSNIYTADSLAHLKAKLSTGEELLSNEAATQYEVCNAANEIEAAVNSLDKRTAYIALDKAVTSASTVKGDCFMASAFKAYTKIVDTAAALLADESATDKELADMTAALETVADSLVKYSAGNVALGGKVEASSTLTSSNWALEKLTDGDRENLRSREVCGFTTNYCTTFDHTEWVGVDMGAVHSIDKIVIMPAGATKGAKAYAFPNTFEIFVSANGKDWISVAKEAGYPVPLVGDEQSFTFEAVDARYIRVLCTSLNPKASDANRFRVQFAELEAYNTDFSSAPHDANSGSRF